jgi:hypothetical protein
VSLISAVVCRSSREKMRKGPKKLTRRVDFKVAQRAPLHTQRANQPSPGNNKGRLSPSMGRRAKSQERAHKKFVNGALEKKSEQERVVCFYERHMHANNEVAYRIKSKFSTPCKHHTKYKSKIKRRLLAFASFTHMTLRRIAYAAKFNIIALVIVPREQIATREGAGVQSKN